MPGGLATGQLVDERYSLEEPLGEDALGTTWRAHDRGLGRGVCLREVRYADGRFADDPAQLKQALMAARLAIRLDHPGAVHVYDAFVDGDRLMIVTEAVPARTLSGLVERRGPLSLKRVATIGLDLLDPLAAAHAKGLVHGAIAPDVVLVPDRAPAQLAGLGLAPSFADETSAGWMDAMGTPSCLAPEQVELRGATAASDLWALGATLYLAAEGTPAFDERHDVVDRSLRPMTRAGVLAPLLERLLSKEPAWRPSIDDLRPELAAIAGVPLAAGEAVAPSTGRRWSRRDRRRAGAEPPSATEPSPADEDAGEDLESGDESDEHDWTAAVGAPDDDEPTWSDWSPSTQSDAPDAWLPDIVLDDDPETVPFAPTTPYASGPPVAASELDLPDDPWAQTGDEDLAAADPAGDGLTAPDLTRNLAAPLAPDNRDALDIKVEVDESPWAPERADLGPAATAFVTPAQPSETIEGEEAPRRFRSTPSWPPPQGRKSLWVIGLCAAIMLVMLALLVTNGRLGRSKAPARNQANNRPVLATDANLVPRDWIAYRHPSVDFTVSYPPQWTLREEGSVITVRDGSTGTELRVDYRKPKGPDPEQRWLTAERDFIAKHPNDYKRLQLSPASYLDHVAALWEYTYLENNQPVHAVDLGFLTKDYGFAMSFRAPAATWDRMLPVFQGFLSSVKAPK